MIQKKITSLSFLFEACITGNLKPKNKFTGFGGLSITLPSGRAFRLMEHIEALDSDFYKWFELWETFHYLGTPMSWLKMPYHTVCILRDFEKYFHVVQQQAQAAVSWQK